MLLDVTIFYEINAQVNSTVQRKSRLVKEIADIISEMSGIGFYWKSFEQKSVNCSKPCFQDNDSDPHVCEPNFIAMQNKIIDQKLPLYKFITL